MSKKLTATNAFCAKCIASIPDPEKPNTFTRVEFTVWCKSQSNDPEARAELEKRQADEGAYAFLDSILTGRVEFKGEFDFENDDGSPLEPIEWVKTNAFAAGAVSVAFWDVINRDVDAKIFKKSQRK